LQITLNAEGNFIVDESELTGRFKPCKMGQYLQKIGNAETGWGIVGTLPLPEEKENNIMKKS
jgi:hypothetical protein